MKVKLYNGDVSERRQCRKIKGKYYKMNSHCFKIDGLWRRIDDPNIIYDAKNNYWDKISKRNAKQLFIRDVNDDNELLYVDNDEEVPDKYEMIYIKGITTFCNSRVIDKLGLDLDKATCCYYDKSKRDEFNNYYSSPFYKRLQYGFKEWKGFFSKRTFVTSEELNINSKYTFGLEIETESGSLKDRDIVKYGLCPLKDGSISGYEYASAPFSNLSVGVNAIKALAKDHTTGINDSVHIHIGNIDTTPNGILKVYHTYFMLQNEIYKMFPPYKKVNNGVKRRDYTAALPDLRDNNESIYLSELMRFLTSGEISKYDGRKLIHPQDQNGRNKWHISARYRYVNVINMIFSDSRTVELRIHEATLNPYKIMYWLLINEAIIDFTQQHNFNDVVMILDEDKKLSSIIRKYARKDHVKALLEYIKERKTTYSKTNSKNDPLFNNELKNDGKYEPKIKLF